MIKYRRHTIRNGIMSVGNKCLTIKIHKEKRKSLEKLICLNHGCVIKMRHYGDNKARNWYIMISIDVL